MADKADIRIVKKKAGHAGHHGGAWKVAYADFVTAMMAFFLVMWIVGLNQGIKQAISGYFKDPAAFMAAVQKGDAAFSVSSMAGGRPDLSEKPPPPPPKSEEQERQGLQRAKETIEKMMAKSPEFSDVRKYVDIKLVDEGMQIDLLEMKQSLFFDSASAHIKPATQKLLARIAAELGNLPNRLIVEGHTDSRPLNRVDGYTNWELSADRANSARHVMESSGLRKDQVAQVRGYADTQPRDLKSPEHFSNRRVSIVVVMNKAMQRQSLHVAKP